MNHPFIPTVQVQLTCHTPDEFQEKAIGWNIDHMQLVRGVYLSSLDLIHTRNMQLSSTTHSVGIRERGGITPNTIAVALPILPPDRKRPYFCGKRLEAEECPVLLPGDDFELFSSGVETYVTLVIDAELLDRKCQQLTGKPFSSMTYSQRLWITTQDQRSLVQAILLLMEKLKRCSPRLSTRQQEGFEKQLAERVLLSIRLPFTKRRKIPNRRQVAYQAELLMRENVQKNPTIEQLCRLIGCSSRTLHLGFKERYGTTPVQYGRILALNAVRKKLNKLPPTGTVTEVAMSCGFYHLGRFSQQYRRLFDELPSVTIERNRQELVRE